MFSTNLSEKEFPIDKNNLQTGTVLQLNGYNDNTYCITGKSISSWDNSVIYDTICIETKVKGKHESYSLKHISQKESNQIQVYITDQILFPSMVEKIMQEANEQAIRDAREKELVELQSEKNKEQLKKDYPYLIPVADGGKVNKNIKKHLQTVFKSVKFSVKDDGYRESVITWTDGPTVRQVKEITDKYKSGYFDGMDDCYKYVISDWHIFGYSQYISTRRNISDNVLLSCIPAIKDAMARAKLNHQANDYNSLEPIEGTDFLLQYDGYYFRVWSDTFKCECIDEEGIAKRLFEDKELPLK